MTNRAPDYPPGAVIAVYQRACRRRHEATSPSAAWLCVRDRCYSQVRGQRVGAAQGGCLSTLRLRAVCSRNGACYQREPQANWTSAGAKLTDPSHHRYGYLACTKNSRGPHLIHSWPACSRRFPLLMITICEIDRRHYYSEKSQNDFELNAHEDGPDGVPPGSGLYQRCLSSAHMREGSRRLQRRRGWESSGGGMNVVATGRGLTMAALASVPARLR